MFRTENTPFGVLYRQRSPKLSEIPLLCGNYVRRILVVGRLGRGGDFFLGGAARTRWVFCWGYLCPFFSPGWPVRRPRGGRVRVTARAFVRVDTAPTGCREAPPARRKGGPRATAGVGYWRNNSRCFANILLLQSRAGLSLHFATKTQQKSRRSGTLTEEKTQHPPNPTSPNKKGCRPERRQPIAPTPTKTATAHRPPTPYPAPEA